MLKGVRVLELSRPETMLSGQILADLGADVITVEPPCGAAGRRLPPFMNERIGLESSLTWHALNRNKRGVTLDVESADGREVFELMARTAMVIIEGRPGHFGSLADDAMVHCTIHPFSASGPKQHYAYTDRTIVAAAGSVTYTGDADRAPLLLPVPQAMMEAGAEAAIGVLAALAARDRDSEGQRVQTSMRVAAMMSAFALPYYKDAGEPLPSRSGGSRTLLGVDIPSFYSCADGFVQVSIAFGGFGAITQRMANWLADAGTLSRDVAATNWSAFPTGDEAADVANLRALVGAVEAAIAPMTKAAVGLAARELGFFASPLLDMREVSEFEQYRQRGLWQSQQLAGHGPIQVPASFAQFSNYAITVRRPAPALSEHTQQVLTEAGLSTAEVQALFSHRII